MLLFNKLAFTTMALIVAMPLAANAVAGRAHHHSAVDACALNSDACVTGQNLVGTRAYNFGSLANGGSSISTDDSSTADGSKNTVIYRSDVSQAMSNDRAPHMNW